MFCAENYGLKSSEGHEVVKEWKLVWCLENGKLKERLLLTSALSVKCESKTQILSIIKIETYRIETYERVYTLRRNFFLFLLGHDPTMVKNYEFSEKMAIIPSVFQHLLSPHKNLSAVAFDSLGFYLELLCLIRQRWNSVCWDTG